MDLDEKQSKAVLDWLLKVGKINAEDFEEMLRTRPSASLESATHIFHSLFCKKPHIAELEDLIGEVSKRASLDACAYYIADQLENPWDTKDRKLWAAQVESIALDFKLSAEEIETLARCLPDFVKVMLSIAGIDRGKGKASLLNTLLHLFYKGLDSS